MVKIRVCLPLLISPCTIKSRSTLLTPAHPGGPGKRAVKRLCGIFQLILARYFMAFYITKNAYFTSMLTNKLHHLGDLLSELCPWTPQGGFRPPDLLLCPPNHGDRSLYSRPTYSSWLQQAGMFLLISSSVIRRTIQNS